MACGIRCSRRLKVCCGVTAILIIILLVILIVLFLTVLKPKDPRITVHPVQLQRFNLVVFPAIELNVTLGILATVQNPNRASFSYQNSTADISYRGDLVAQAPIYADTIPASGEHNVSTTLNVFADQSKFQDLPADIAGGVVNFTSASTLQGKAKILNIFKVKATSHTACDISLFIQTNSASSICTSKISS